MQMLYRPKQEKTCVLLKKQPFNFINVKRWAYKHIIKYGRVSARPISSDEETEIV